MSPEQEIERSMLTGKDREELHTIAGAMGVKAATRMRKADLIDAILAATSGASASNGESDAPAPKPRRVRSARASELEQDSIAALADEEAALAASTAVEEDTMPRPSHPFDDHDHTVCHHHRARRHTVERGRCTGREHRVA